MKRRLRTLERDWWDNILDEWRGAKEIGDMDSVYRILRQLGTRNYDNQSGFRIGRSTADATQILVRITEDTDDLKKRNKAGTPDNHSSDPEARLLDLRKAYPRVNKPVLWEMLRRNGMQGDFLNSIIDLHEATKYQVKGKEENSLECLPERGLREGFSTSPCLFNVYHRW
ncbi:uncharacterized protein LOC142336617 [Convolutriloba macropyga]|uniref:uncharacterized protein LOC142336617 n=1 Tax=Convolutriloba macropyga TaxID=536237 RepID=UPI003F522244